MDADGIRDVVHDVFGPNVYMKEISGWWSMHCPLSPWTHDHGRDGSPSAGISIQPNGASIFNCFTCHNKMPLHALIARYAEYTGEDWDELIAELEDEEYLGPLTIPTWESKHAGLAGEILMPLNEGIYMDLYDSAAGHPYLEERFISDETARKLELLFDPADPADGHPRILFPVRGPDGALYGFTGRDVSGKAKLKVRDYHGLKKAHCVLGSHLVESENPDKVLVVEGLFDYANAWECGYPGCAVMHSTMTAAQASIFKNLGKPTYLFYDNPRIDTAGADGVKIAGDQLAPFLPVMKVRYPEVWIPDAKGGHWLKDPGELLPEEFEAMIQDCRLYLPS